MRLVPTSMLLLVLCGHFASAGDEGPFPTASLQPRAETGVLRFLEQHPEFDGRGVVVAIFDTGVDPGAPGLQVTSDDRPKILDVIDGTGSGDVDTTTVVEPTDGVIEGLTGRKLTLEPQWSNPSGRYHLGMKAAYDFFPGPLVARLKRERKRDFLEAQRRVEATLRREIATWEAAHSAKDRDADEKLWHRELEQRLEQLRAIETSHDDPGPVFDCVTFHDGERWRAVVDTDEDGDLAEERVLTDFRVDREYATFPFGSLLNFAVNVYDDGNRLSIVVDSGTHGTHVAGIVAANDPETPERNGIAPGAQIVSVKIGDTRLGTMETEAGFTRGMAAVLRNGCDAINLSYGEPTSTPNRGRLVQLFSELVNEHGVVFVAAAGNEGPAFSTVGAPGGTTSAVLGVGAYVSPELARSAYALRERTNETAYTWTSGGPTADGDLGVDVFAPGGAVAPVPEWSLQPSERMNGTSMASPNACGSVALLLSAAKGTKTDVTPYSVRRALQNTARRIESLTPFAQGAGLIQVDAAWKYLEKHEEDTGERLPYDVIVGDGQRGILLRNWPRLRTPWTGEVRIRPRFPRSTPKETIARFEQRLRLRATEPWVETGEFLLLNRRGGEFEVRVDTGHVDIVPGAHFAWIEAFDVDDPDRGPVARVPVTVIIPDAGSHGDVGRSQRGFAPGHIDRRFLIPPTGTTWAEVELRVPANAEAGERTFSVHTVQVADGETFEKHQFQEYVTLRPGESTTKSFAVEPGLTLELCLAQYWSSLGEGPLESEVRFRGLRPDQREIVLSEADATQRVTVESLLAPQRLLPRAKLVTRRRMLTPKSSTRRVLQNEREGLPSGRPVQELVLEYEFEQKEAGEVTIRVPSEEDLLYDATTGGYVLVVFDEHERRVGFDDVYPDPIELAEGKHEVVLRFRHSEPDVLDRLAKTRIAIDQPLAKPVAIRVVESRAAAADPSSKFRPRGLAPGEWAALVVVAPTTTPAGVRGGDVLLGTITYGAEGSGRNGLGQRPGGFPLRWVVTTTISDGDSRDADDDATKFPAAKLSGRERKLDARLRELDTTATRKQHLAEIVEICDALLAGIDRDELAMEFGTRVGESDPRAVAKRRAAEATRDRLSDLLYRKGRALGYMELPDVVAEHPVENPRKLDRDFESNFRELAKWVDTTDPKWALLHIRRDRRKQRYGLALERLAALETAKGQTYWTVKKRRDVYESLGWTHAWEHERRRLAIRFPKVRDPL